MIVKHKQNRIFFHWRFWSQYLNVKIVFVFEMVHFTSFSKSKSVLGFRDCETSAESYFFSLTFLEPILKCHHCLRIDLKDVVCRSRFFTNLPKLKVDKA